jgi:hypothetical protein
MPGHIMTATSTDLTFDQGIGNQIVIPNLKDSSGVLLDLTNFIARMQIRQGAASLLPLLTKSSSDSGIVLSTTKDGQTVTANSITISVTDDDCAAFQPSALAIGPIAQIFDGAPTYAMGIWECRVYSQNGQGYSVARGSVYLTLAVVQSDGTSTPGTPSSPSSPSSPSYAPASVTDGSTFVVPDSAQVVSAMPIQIDGTLQVDGFLIEV